MSTIKRLYFYGVAFVALTVAVYGSSLLIRYLIDMTTGRQLTGRPSEQVSLGLAMVIVSAPIWALHWGMAQRHVRRRPEEAGSALRKLYIYAVLFVAATTVFFMTRELLRWLLGAGAFRGDEPAFRSSWVANIVVWSAAWAFHWRMELAEGQPSPGARTMRRWHQYLVSLYSLAFLAGGIAIALGIVLTRVYDAFIQTPSMVGESGTLWTITMRGAIVSVVIGAIWWAFHWLFQARRDVESTLRQVYLFLFAFLGGAVTAIVALGMLLNASLRWLLGAPDLGAAAVHFRTVPGVLPALLVGLGLLGYHWAVVQEESGRVTGRLLGARRSFGYIVSALGLATLAIGAILLTGAVLHLLVPSARDPLTLPRAGRDVLSIGLTFLLSGAPLWAFAWTRTQRAVQRSGLDERSALSRRLFLYLVLGALALAALGGLVGLLFQVLRNTLEGDLSLEFLRTGKWFLSTTVVAGAFLFYYLQVLREDLQAGSETRMLDKSVTLVVDEKAEEIAAQIEQALGTRLRLYRVVAPSQDGAAVAPPLSLSSETLETMVQHVKQAASDRVLVVVDGASVKVYPYR